MQQPSRKYKCSFNEPYFGITIVQRDHNNVREVTKRDTNSTPIYQEHPIHDYAELTTMQPICVNDPWVCKQGMQHSANFFGGCEICDAFDQKDSKTLKTMICCDMWHPRRVGGHILRMIHKRNGLVL